MFSFVPFQTEGTTIGNPFVFVFDVSDKQRRCLIDTAATSAFSKVVLL